MISPHSNFFPSENFENSSFFSKLRLNHFMVLNDEKKKEKKMMII